MKKIDDMTDAELDAELAKAAAPKKAEEMTDAELDAQLQKYTDSLGEPDNSPEEFQVLKQLASDIGNLLDYPVAPVRAAFDANIKSIKSGGKEYPTDAIAESLVQGPSAAPSPTEVAVDLGVPTQPTVNLPVVGETSPANVAGMALDTIMSANIGKGAKDLLKGAGAAIVKPEEQVIKAINLPSKTVKEGLYAGEKSTKNLKNITDYAAKEIVTPFGSTRKYFDKVVSRTGELGRKMQTIYQGNKKSLEAFLSDPKTDPLIVKEYLEGGFQRDVSLPRMSQAVDDLKMSTADKNKVMEFIKTEVEADLKGHTKLDATKLAELDSYWSKKANNMMKDKPDTVAEAAYGILRDEAELGKQFELEFAKKNYLSSNDYQQLKAIDSEYAKLKNIERGLRDKLVSEMKGANIDLTKPPILNNTRVQSFLSKFPDAGLGDMAQGAMIAGPMLRAPMTMNEKFIEGFPMGKTLQVTPEEGAVFKSEISNNPDMDSIQKAKRLNLLQKHGRVYIGQ